MPSVALNVKPRAGAGQVVGYYTLTSSRYVSAIMIVVASDTDEVKEMIQFIPVYETKAAGTYPIVWDGYNYLGVDVSGTNDYIAEVVYFTPTYNYWIVGSNSTLKHGETTFRGYSPNVGIFFAGNKTFFNHSWDEGQSIKGAYVDKSVDIKSQVNLGYGGTSNFSGPAFEYGCKVPGKNIVILGGENSAQGYEGDNIVYAYNSSTDAALTLANGTTYNAGSTTYSVFYQGAEKISGITANGDYCYVTFAGTNKCRIYLIGTTGSPDGTLVDTVVTTTIDANFTTPVVFAQSFDDSSFGNRIWAMNKTTSQVFKLDIDAGTGALSSGLLTTNFGSGYKVSLAVNNSNHTIAFTVGAGYQQIRFFNINSANPGGSVFKTWGTAGGYESGTNCAVVTNTKWSFYDNSTGIDKGTPRGFIGFSDDGEFWVGDTGNRRTLRFSFTFTTSPSRDYTFTYVDQVDQIGAVYNPNINMKDATELYIGGLRYSLDPDTGVYTLTHNYQAQMSANNLNGRDYINKVTNYTSSTGVKRIAIINDYSTSPYLFPLVELTDDGIVTLMANYADTGTANLGDNIDEDFTSYRIDAASYAVGQPYDLDYQTLNEAGGVWTKSAWINEASGTIEAGDTQSEAGNVSYQSKIGTGNFLFCNADKDGNTDFLLECSNPSGVKKWRVIQRTTRPNEAGAGYTGDKGQVPAPAWFTAGNGVNDMFYKFWSKGDFAISSNNYEDFKGKQGNYIYLIYKNGTPLYKFHTDRWKAEAYEDHGIEADGNCQYFQAAYLTDGRIMVFRSSEGGHAGGQATVIDVSSVTRKRIPIAPPTYETIRGTRQLLELDPVSIFSDTTHIVLSEAQGGSFKVETNIMHPDRANPDLHIYSTAGGNHDRYVTNTINPVRDASMKHWEYSFYLNFMDHGATELTDFPAAYVRIKDGAGKIIARVGLGILGFAYRLWANDTVIKNTTDANDYNNYLCEWNNCYIKVNSLGCQITFGNETTVYVDIFDPTADWSDPTTIDIGCETKTGGTGTGSIAIRQDADYYDTQVSDVAPIANYANFTTRSATEILLPTDQFISGTEVGFPITANGSPLAVNSRTTEGNVVVLHTDEIHEGDVLLSGYVPGTGDTVNGDNVELTAFSNKPVTNTVVAPVFTRVDEDAVNNSGATNSLSTKAFNVQAGDFMAIYIKFSAARSINSISDGVNTYTLDTSMTSTDYKGAWYSCKNCAANAATVITATLDTNDTLITIYAVQNRGVGVVDTTANGNSNATSSVTSSAFTTSQSNTYALCMLDDFGDNYVSAWTQPTGFTVRKQDTRKGGVVCDYVYSSVQTGITLTGSAPETYSDRHILVVIYKL